MCSTFFLTQLPHPNVPAVKYNKIKMRMNMRLIKRYHVECYAHVHLIHNILSKQNAYIISQQQQQHCEHKCNEIHFSCCFCCARNAIVSFVSFFFRSKRAPIDLVLICLLAGYCGMALALFIVSSHKQQSTFQLQTITPRTHSNIVKCTNFNKIFACY